MKKRFLTILVILLLLVVPLTTMTMADGNGDLTKSQIDVMDTGRGTGENMDSSMPAQQKAEGYLQSLQFFCDYSVIYGFDLGIPAVNFKQEPAFDPAVSSYSLYVPDAVSYLMANIKLTDDAPENTDITMTYGSQTVSYLDDCLEDGSLVLRCGVSYESATMTISVTGGRTYTYQIVRQPQIGYLSITDSDDEECLSGNFINTQFDGHTAYIPYEGATVTARPQNNDTVIKIGETIVNDTYALHAENLWEGEAGNRSFNLKLDTTCTSVEEARAVYIVACKERPMLEVMTAPNKTLYLEGETFDPSGLVVTATYHGGTTVDIPVDKLTFNTTTMTLNGDAVTASYEGATVTLTGLNVVKALNGEGTMENPYLLSNAEDLATLSCLVASGENYAGYYFKITDDITLPDNWTPIGSLKEGKTWTPLLTLDDYYVFSGNIDGLKDESTGECYTITVPKGSKTMLGALQYSTISNLNIYGEQIEGYGVVNYYCRQASGIVLEHITLKSGSHTKYSGFIGGYASGSNPVIIRNCTVEQNVVIGNDGTVAAWKEELEQSYNYAAGPGEVQYNDMVGSFAGAFNGTIENCVSHATVYGSNYVGGIVGFKGQSMGNCIIRECIFDGEVSASGDYVGGIAGSGYASASAPNTPCVTIQNCAVTGTVTGNNYVGGIFGGNATIRQCWNNSIGYIRSNYFAGTLAATAENAVVGGIIGHINAIDRYNIIENNYYLKGTAVKGIGSITTVDTDTTKEYGRNDDPMYTDAYKLADAFEGSELANGELVKKLNAATAGDVWVQSESAPALNSERHVISMVSEGLNPMRAKTFKQSTILAVLDTAEYEITVTWSDGSIETVMASQCVLGGLDLTTSGYQLGTLSYNGYQLCFGAKINADDSDAANLVIDQIDAIGAVTLESEDSIVSAETAYNALTDNQKAMVSNYDVLVSAREAYDKLASDHAAADAVKALIDAIGTVNRRSKEKIDAARKAYEDLTEEQKALVTNYDVLVKGEKAYEKLLASLGTGTETAPEQENAPDFVDVSTGDWFYDAVNYVCSNGLMNGTGNGAFSPNATTTRGMIVTILARMEGVDTSKGDVWYEAGRQWAMENGISDGTNMDGQITREQLTAMLYRYAMHKGYDVSARADLDGFTDRELVSDWAMDAMQWAVGTGLVQGDGNCLNPNGTATRAQAATMLMRFEEKLQSSN